jgi:hypothetical protein
VKANRTGYMVMSRDQNSSRSRNIQIHNNHCGRVQIFVNDLKRSIFYSGKNEEHFEIRECVLSFGAESLVFRFANENLKI